MFNLYRVRLTRDYLVVTTSPEAAVEAAESALERQETPVNGAAKPVKITRRWQLSPEEDNCIPVFEPNGSPSDVVDAMIRRLFYETEALAKDVLRILTFRGKCCM